MRRSRLGALLLVLAFSLACDGDGGGGGGPPMGPAGPDFSMDQDIQGVINVTGDVTIPAGVTSTVGGDLTLNVTGNVTINGTLGGDCVVITINATGDVTITGMVRNGCAGPIPANAPALTIVGDGDTTLDGATIESSGDIEIKNDPTLTDADFPANLVPITDRGLSLAQDGVRFRVNGSTVRFVGGSAGPGQAEEGESGRTARLFVRGNLEVASNNALNGQDGGNGTPDTGTAVAVGGDGGEGGFLRILVTGTLTFTGGNNTFRSGNGGPGGSATATNPNGDAEATGGNGAAPGLMEVRGNGGIMFAPGGAITLQIGDGGNGGPANATGSDGIAGTCDGVGADDGHSGTATGGDGGSSPDARLRVSGTTGGAPTVTGANGGEGGSGDATGGRGADGSADCKDGGTGGAMTADGGTGGDAQVRNQAGNLVGSGGAGGSAALHGGRGGDGLACCDPPEQAGFGGVGGEGSADDGDGGTGVTGVAMGGGVSTDADTGDGGDGKDGIPPGLGGAGGGFFFAITGADNTDPDAFMKGMDGMLCPLPPPTSSQVAGPRTIKYTFVSSNCPGDPPPGEMFTADATIVDEGSNQIAVVFPDAPEAIRGNYDPATGRFMGTTGIVDLGDGLLAEEIWDVTFTQDAEGHIMMTGTSTVNFTGAVNCTRQFTVEVLVGCRLGGFGKRGRPPGKPSGRLAL